MSVNLFWLGAAAGAATVIMVALIAELLMQLRSERKTRLGRFIND